MYIPRVGAALLGLLLAGAAGNLYADEVQIPVGSQATSKATMDRPGRGMARTTVLKRFGQPIASTGPVGDPPISRLEYPDYYVYFEYDTVIHTVLRRDS